MLPTLLAAVGIPALLNILSGALGKIDHPAAKMAAESLDTLDKALESGKITPEAMNEANRHAEKMARLELQKHGETLDEIHESLRMEIGSEDPYVRRMRPTFGYLMALTWAAQMFGLAWVIVFRTDQASVVLEAVESLGLIWTVGLSVLGVYVYKRSEDKKIKNGVPIPGRKPV